VGAYKAGVFRRAKQLETACLETRALEELIASVELDAPEPLRHR
jgi:hypothetical protein